MPGVDFHLVRSQISIAQVLDLLGFVSQESSGDQVRGPCPVHRSTARKSRSFSANLAQNTFQCFTCGASGNQLDLWVAVTKRPIHEAAVELCTRLHQEIPWVRRW